MRIEQDSPLRAPQTAHLTLRSGPDCGASAQCNSAALAQVVALVVTFLIAAHATGSTLVPGASTDVVVVGALWVIAGYSFYCTAFAAAGSLAERPADGTVVSIPIQLPIMLAYLLSVLTGATGRPAPARAPTPAEAEAGSARRSRWRPPP